MNGPQHYRAAEGLLRTCTNTAGDVYTNTFEPLTAATAHATLALAAAMVFVAKAGVNATGTEMAQWDKVTGPAKRRET